jgi:hypothetical protein
MRLEVLIKGTRMAADLDTATGLFWMYVDGQKVEDESVAGLRKKAERVLRQAAVKIEVPFSTLDGGALRHGTATGLHARNRTVLVRWDDGETGQLGKFGRATAFARLTDEQTAAYADLLARQRAISGDRKAFEAEHGVDLRELVSEAVRAAAGDGPGPC